MKKFLVILMILALCLTAVTACGKDESLDKAAEYVRSLYVGSDVTPADFDVVGKLKLDGADYTVEWSVDVADGVSVKESANAGFFTVDVNEKTESEISYKLTLTVKNAKADTSEFSNASCITMDADGKLIAYLADVDDDGTYTGETNVIRTENGITFFDESADRSAPYFNIIIDGITVK